MIELLVKTHLDSHLDMPVYMERPEKVSGRYLLVEKTGSGQGNQLKSATVIIQSYAESLYEAAALNERVKDAMATLVAMASLGSLSIVTITLQTQRRNLIDTKPCMILTTTRRNYG